MQAPCKNCAERSIRCHSTCDKYREFAEENNRMRENKYRENEIITYNIEKYNKAVRIKSKKGRKR